MGVASRIAAARPSGPSAVGVAPDAWGPIAEQRRADAADGTLDLDAHVAAVEAAGRDVGGEHARGGHQPGLAGAVGEPRRHVVQLRHAAHQHVDEPLLGGRHRTALEQAGRSALGRHRADERLASRRRRLGRAPERAQHLAVAEPRIAVVGEGVRAGQQSAIADDRGEVDHPERLAARAAVDVERNEVGIAGSGARGEVVEAARLGDDRALLAAADVAQEIEVVRLRSLGHLVRVDDQIPAIERLQLGLEIRGAGRAHHRRRDHPGRLFRGQRQLVRRARPEVTVLEVEDGRHSPSGRCAGSACAPSGPRRRSAGCRW